MIKFAEAEELPPSASHPVASPVGMSLLHRCSEELLGEGEQGASSAGGWREKAAPCPTRPLQLHFSSTDYPSPSSFRRAHHFSITRDPGSVHGAKLRKRGRLQPACK